MTSSKGETQAGLKCLLDASVVAKNGSNIFQALAGDFEHKLQEIIVLSGLQRVLVTLWS